MRFSIALCISVGLANFVEYLHTGYLCNILVGISGVTVGIYNILNMKGNK